MADFHISISGSDTEENVDAMIKDAQKFVKSLQKRGSAIESAAINSGHFLGGSRDLVLSNEGSPEGVVES